jgi:hypothetical protein
VEDGEVIDAFVVGGAVHAFGAQLHIEGDTLAYDGWWKAAFRIAPTTFAVRNEDPPERSDILDAVPERLRAAGLKEVAGEPSFLFAITYTAIDLGPADWSLWSVDEATADAALRARAGADAFFDDPPPLDSPPDRTELVYDAQRGGARRTAGLAPKVVLAVGVAPAAAEAMAGALDNCRVEVRALGHIDADGCGTLMPDLAIVDASSDAGLRFLLELRGTASGATLPLVALGDEGTWSPADVTVAVAAGPEAWADHVRRLLP